jgi:hypothetical protein
MNPNGVFVVERPGLSHFFQQLSSFAGTRPSRSMLCCCNFDIVSACVDLGMKDVLLLQR